MKDAVVYFFGLGVIIVIGCIFFSFVFMFMVIIFGLVGIVGKMFDFIMGII